MFHLRRLATCVACLASLVTVVPAPVLASWPRGSNVNVPLCTSPDQQLTQGAVSDGAGGAIVLWDDYRKGTEFDLYAQRVDAKGVPLWAAEGLALSTAIYSQWQPCAAGDGAGGMIVAYLNVGGDNTDRVLALRVTPQGTLPWGNPVALGTASVQGWAPSICSDGGGGAFVAWTDLNTYNVYAQHINSDGSLVWTAASVLVCAGSAEPQQLAVVPDGRGGAIVAWQDKRGTTGSDVYAQRVSAAGANAWAVNGVSVCSATGDQTMLVAMTDGYGGAYVAWQDGRPGTTTDIYAQRLSNAGTAEWTADGRLICGATGSQQVPRLVSDEVGGAYLTWSDQRTGGWDIYAQHLVATGTSWAANGIPVCASSGDQAWPTAIADGSGGMLVAWLDARGPTAWDLYGQRVALDGFLAWSLNGAAISTAPGSQHTPVLASDGAGGVVMGWIDYRNGTSYPDVYCQHISGGGRLGGPEPNIARVSDVPNDQGGQVRVAWDACALDSSPRYSIGRYDVWRQVPAIRAAALRSSGVGSSSLRHQQASDGTMWYWEFVASQAARGFAGYSLIAPTTSDSLAGSNPQTVFMVEAVDTSAANTYYDSPPDSGYSVDNLPPAMPTAFTGNFTRALTTLQWNENVEQDLAGYELYGSTSPGFTPGPSTLVISTTEPHASLANRLPAYYMLCARDIHGNASAPATLLPTGTTEVPVTEIAVLALEAVRPNPSQGGGLKVAFTLASAAPARLELLDVSGRRVIEREVGLLGAGQRAVVDLAPNDRLAAGLYVVRLTQAGDSRVSRVVVLK